MAKYFAAFLAAVLLAAIPPAASLCLADGFTDEFRGAKIDDASRPYTIFNAAGDPIWKEIFTGFADPANDRAGSLPKDPPITRIRIDSGELSIYDASDIERDDGRGVTFVSQKPLSAARTSGFVFRYRHGMLRGHRGTGCSFSSLRLADDSNSILIERGSDTYGAGSDFNARLELCGKTVYDAEHDAITLPEGFTTVNVRIVNMPSGFEYYVNDEKLYSAAYIPFDESKTFVSVGGVRWNWKGPLNAAFSGLECGGSTSEARLK